MALTEAQEHTATYREVFAVGEFRALFASYVLSLTGDWLAKVALSILVFHRSGSALFAALAFGIGYLPYVLGGPVLSALADRLPRRTVMIGADLVRAVLVALLALPGIPLWLLLLVLFVTELFAPPFSAARSALLPEVLEGDKYVVGNGITHMADQGAQVLGYAVGGLLVAVLSARGSLLVDAGTFLASAVLVGQFVRHRPAEAPSGQPRVSLLRETGEGIRFVFGNRVLLAFILLAWAGSAVAAAPEGLAAPYAHYLGGGGITAGLYLAANPFGFFVGALVVGRFVNPALRRRLVRPLALLSCAALVPVALDPGLPVLLVLLAVVGFGLGYNLPLNQMFVQAVPPRLRGRAFGVAASGLMVFQGVGTFAAGAMADAIPTPYVVALLGAAGVLGVGWVCLRWPSDAQVVATGPELAEAAASAASSAPAAPAASPERAEQPVHVENRKQRRASA